MTHISIFQKNICKVKFYPSADDFTQALLVMLLTNIMSVQVYLLQCISSTVILQCFSNGYFPSQSQLGESKLAKFHQMSLGCSFLKLFLKLFVKGWFLKCISRYFPSQQWQERVDWQSLIRGQWLDWNRQGSLRLKRQIRNLKLHCHISFSRLDPFSTHYRNCRQIIVLAHLT